MIEKLAGENITMRAVGRGHFEFKEPVKGSSDFISQFGDAVKSAMGQVNDMDVKSDKLSMQMMLQPESVNVHDVMIAAQNAQMALELSRNVIQKIVQGYQTLTNLR